MTVNGWTDDRTLPTDGFDNPQDVSEEIDLYGEDDGMGEGQPCSISEGYCTTHFSVVSNGATLSATLRARVIKAVGEPFCERGANWGKTTPAALNARFEEVDENGQTAHDRLAERRYRLGIGGTE